MDPTLRELLNELEQAGRDYDAHEPVHQKRMRNLEPETAHLISILVRSRRCQSLLEIGTSNGYSTLWLAWAARHTGGHITSLERLPEKHALAAANLNRAGLSDYVDLITGDATEIVAGLPGPFDFVLFDADRISAPEQLRLLLPRLLPGALVLADNVLSHPQEIAAYLAAVESLPDFDHTVVPVGKGLSIAYKS
ncbi:MAG: class I SAM-dependent methyltransferase [Anaerolineae bacterium]|nr:class I SAM-dependent methyltransferase [Anaerolineae bacterium]